MKIVYQRFNFRPATLEVIETANKVIDAYQADDLRLTLRQLYYRFIAGDLFPDSWADPRAGGSKNTQRNYRRLGKICGNARLAGLMDWSAIEDRTRGLRRRPHWDSPADIVRSCADQFSVDRWRGQRHYVEVWFEKDALAGVFSEPANGLDVPYFSCRGYGSLSELWAAGRRIARHARSGRIAVVLHFGDHDPSGIDMTRDIRDRLSLFAENAVAVERIALNFDQVEEHDPPPNPAKATDSRYSGYVSRFGEESWELDALEPRLLRDLVDRHVRRWLDADLYSERLEVERAGQNLLSAVADHWAGIEDEYGPLAE